MTSKLLNPVGIAAIALMIAMTIAATVLARPPAQKPLAVYIPDTVQAPSWIAQRWTEQLATRSQFEVDYDFHFDDIQPGSGIDFLHRVVDDSGKYYKPVHYDHGNGIVAADVDLDGLSDIYFVSQAGPNRLYHNLGQGRFEDITARAGVGVEGSIHVTATFADFDNDGDPDLYVTNVRSPNRLFENDGDGTFVDVSANSGLDFNEHSSSAIALDYDRDGLLDVFLTVVGEYTGDDVAPVTGTVDSERPEGPDPIYYVGYEDAFSGHLFPERLRKSRLFRNQGDNTFRDVTESVGLDDEGFSGDATPTDFNNDGWPDLYVLNMQGHDHYWVNRQGERFEDRSEDVFPDTPWGAMSVKSFDYDNDGDMDMILTDMHSDMSLDVQVDQEKLKSEWLLENWTEPFLHSEGHSIFGNAFYRNDGNGSFEEVSDELNTENFWPWGLSVADLNADGWQDVFIASSMSFPFRYAVNSLLLNNAGKRFMDSEYILGVEPRRDGQTAKPWFKLDCSGVDREHRDCAGREGPVVIYGALGTRSSLIFDFDEDGDLDIVTNEFGANPQVLQSDLSERRGGDLRYLKIRLRGTRSNRDALGARVTVSAGDRSWVQVYDGQSGYLSQSSLPLYFGLDGVNRVDRIEVSWPSGSESTLDTGISLNQLIEITEPTG